MIQLAPATPVAVWIATALLHSEHEDKEAFRTNEIFEKVKEVGLQRASDATLGMHISYHCVANGKANPDTHRKLFRVASGWYRLYRIVDPCHPSRENGRIEPLAEEMPEKYRRLLDWYRNSYCERQLTTSQHIGSNASKPHFVRIEKDVMIKLPGEILGKLRVAEGDYLAFVDQSADSVLLKKARVQLDV